MLDFWGLRDNGRDKIMRRSAFATQTPIEKRKAYFQRLQARHPGHVPVICEPSGNLPQPARSKYLVPNDKTVADFMVTLRRTVQLAPEQAIILFVGNEQAIPCGNTLMSEVYRTHMSKDDEFLYMCYATENTFG